MNNINNTLNNKTNLKLILMASVLVMFALTWVVNAGQNKPVKNKHKQHKDHKDYTFTATESINKALQFDDLNSGDNHLTVFNVNGSVDVESYTGDEVLVAAENQVFGQTKELLQIGLDEIGLKFAQQDHKMQVYLDSPFTYIDQDSGKIRHSDTCWRHDDCSRKHERKAYRYHMNILVKVPENTSLKVSTINQGDINITGISAKTISAHNINGAINMNDISAQVVAHAINQSINVIYHDNPTADSSYETINGNLNLTFANNPNFEAVYKTLNGAFYTDFDVSTMSPKVKRTVEQKKHGIQYKLDASNRLVVGTGGPELTFKTLNGDIKLQQSSD